MGEQSDEFEPPCGGEPHCFHRDAYWRQRAENDRLRKALADIGSACWSNTTVPIRRMVERALGADTGSSEHPR